jgi:hypothetical protein
MLIAQDSSWTSLQVMKTRLFAAAALLLILPKDAFPQLFESHYAKAIRRAAEMPRNDDAQKVAAEFGLNILDLTWEDTGRYKDSSVGPNISDMTIQVSRDKGKSALEVTCMPVVRFPNFSDKTCDLDPRAFSLLVGNHNGSPLKRVSLHDVLASPLRYLSKPDSWKPKGGKQRTLLAERDDKVLVSAQACFLPIPQEGKATFNPVLFNYQSIKGDPAVLAILATREGTSMTIIDNVRDAFDAGSAWGQRLFFNSNGQRASLTGERESDFKANKDKPDDQPAPQAASESGMNMVLLIQVPLKQKARPQNQETGGIQFTPVAPAPAESDVENAVIGHGDLEGPFTETDNLSIERDTRFPVRVTVQFYKATSNGVVSRQDFEDIKKQIDRVYADSDYIGSLVTSGITGRKTEYQGPKEEPEGWWKKFWKRQVGSSDR